MKTWLIVSSCVLLVSGCGNGVPEAANPESSVPVESVAPTNSASPTVTPEASQSPVDLPDANSTLISEGGIGPAKLGMTLGELKQQLGSEVEFAARSPFIVDFDAIAVTRAGEQLFYILHLAGEPLDDTDMIQGLFTDNPAFQTDQGVGPGVTIQQAEQAYGQPTLSYNTENEAREYVRFERQPASNISFATGNGNETTAGIYASAGGGYNETQQYREGATINSVLIVCLTEDCAGSQ